MLKGFIKKAVILFGNFDLREESFFTVFIIVPSPKYF